MQRLLYTLVFLTITAVIVYAAQLAVTNFTASFQGSDVRLEWQMTDEAGVMAYDISRKKADETEYVRITTINGNTGQNGSYYFVDNLLKNNNESGTINYRLQVKGSSGTGMYYTNVSNMPTAVQRSWGSIKSMFR